MIPPTCAVCCAGKLTEYNKKDAIAIMKKEFCL